MKSSSQQVLPQRVQPRRISSKEYSPEEYHPEEYHPKSIREYHSKRIAGRVSLSAFKLLKTISAGTLSNRHLTWPSQQSRASIYPIAGSLVGKSSIAMDSPIGESLHSLGEPSEHQPNQRRRQSTKSVLFPLSSRNVRTVDPTVQELLF